MCWGRAVTTFHFTRSHKRRPCRYVEVRMDGYRAAIFWIPWARLSTSQQYYTHICFFSFNAQTVLLFTLRKINLTTMCVSRTGCRGGYGFCANAMQCNGVVLFSQDPWRQVSFFANSHEQKLGTISYYRCCLYPLMWGWFSELQARSKPSRAMSRSCRRAGNTVTPNPCRHCCGTAACHYGLHCGRV